MPFMVQRVACHLIDAATSISFPPCQEQKLRCGRISLSSKLFYFSKLGPQFPCPILLRVYKLPRQISPENLPSDAWIGARLPRSAHLCRAPFTERSNRRRISARGQMHICHRLIVLHWMADRGSRGGHQQEWAKARRSTFRPVK
jgi:hypothetical protein